MMQACLEAKSRWSVRGGRALLLGAAVLVGLLAPLAARADTVKDDPFLRRDDAYAFEVVGEEVVGGVKIRTVKLTSQRWQGAPWTHWLRVIEPETLVFPSEAVLVIGGGRNRNDPPKSTDGRGSDMLPLLALKTGTTVAYLEQVPNQPLFENLREDALIAHTFQKFVETGDPEWPAIVPMVRSAMRAMDTVQALSEVEGKPRVKSFFVTGASKRGWTTWLTASRDPRVKGIAPMVIDVLNIRAQMPHQLASFGDYSEKIGDYTQLGLPQRLDDPRAQALLDLVDPYSVREKITCPKLVILGTNDPYWPVDAARHYQKGLVGPSWFYVVPNTGHGLDATAMPSALAFYRRILEGRAVPKVDFTWTGTADGAELLLSASERPARIELWGTSSATRDFRKSVWETSADAPKAETLGGAEPLKLTFAAPKAGHEAKLVTLVYTEPDGSELRLTTTVHVVSAKRADF